MKLALVVGTRPEIIKMAPVIKECQKREIEFVLIHSNQHYSSNMDEIFFKELELPQPDYNLAIHQGDKVNQVGNIIIKLESVLQNEKPDVVLAQGDTNTVVASALAASHLQIPFGHIESGLRSYDRKMPEENNRIVADQLSTFLFAVTKNQLEILKSEGVPAGKIFVVGNTVTDVVEQYAHQADNESFLKQLELEKKNYYLVTIHRASNVDSKEALEKILEVFKLVYERYKTKLIWPIHPRTAKKIEEFGIKIPGGLSLVEPMGYTSFLTLQKNAKLIFTDSGGVQEESCILKTPCITLRENTERPETLQVGANFLCDTSIEKIFKAIDHFSSLPNFNWKNPFGDGKTSERILDVIVHGSCQVFSEEKKTSLKNKKISVIGLGYMGLPIACLFAKAGYKVSGVDINEKRVKTVARGESPFNEPGLQDLISAAIATDRLSTTTKPEASDVFFISVPTPVHEEKCDLKFVELAAKNILPVLKDGDLVILESTSKPGTCDTVLKNIFDQANKDVLIAYCPERAIPGNTIYELIHNDRVVGGVTSEATLKAKDIIESISLGNVYTTDSRTAEAVKLIENTYRDVNIALANELELVSRDLKFNIWKAIELANKHPRVNVLQPGPGVGGHCIAVDPWFLCEGTDHAELIRQARKINDERPLVIVSDVHEVCKKNNYKKILVLGVAYKKNVDDCRETPAEHVVQGLMEKGYQLKIHDAHATMWIYPLVQDLKLAEKWADCTVLITDHDEYKDFQSSKTIIDSRNFFNAM